MSRALRGVPALVLATAIIVALNGCALLPIASATSQSQLEAEANATLKSELANVAIAAASYAVGNNGSYSGATLHELELAGLTPDQVPPKFTIIVDPSGNSYCAQGTTKFGQTEHDESGTISNGAC